MWPQHLSLVQSSPIRCQSIKLFRLNLCRYGKLVKVFAYFNRLISFPSLMFSIQYRSIIFFIFTGVREQTSIQIQWQSWIHSWITPNCWNKINRISFPPAQRQSHRYGSEPCLSVMPMRSFCMFCTLLNPPQAGSTFILLENKNGETMSRQFISFSSTVS